MTIIELQQKKAELEFLLKNAHQIVDEYEYYTINLAESITEIQEQIDDIEYENNMDLDCY